MSRRGTGLAVYVAAPYGRAPLVRELHAELRKVGCIPTSHWANLAQGPDDLTREDENQIALDLNRIGIENSNLLIALTFGREGGEMFVEAGHALWEGIPVLWCGDRLMLSCYHPLSRVLPGAVLGAGSKRRLIDLCARIARACNGEWHADRILDEIDRSEPSMLAVDPHAGPIGEAGVVAIEHHRGCQWP